MAGSRPLLYKTLLRFGSVLQEPEKAPATTIKTILEANPEGFDFYWLLMIKMLGTPEELKGTWEVTLADMVTNSTATEALRGAISPEKKNFLRSFSATDCCDAVG